MTVLFDQFCDLVERGRKAGKSVLVCSAKGRNRWACPSVAAVLQPRGGPRVFRAPAFCAAYLISKERMTRQQAVAKVIEQVAPVSFSFWSILCYGEVFRWAPCALRQISPTTCKEHWWDISRLREFRALTTLPTPFHCSASRELLGLEHDGAKLRMVSPNSLSLHPARARIRWSPLVHLWPFVLSQQPRSCFSWRFAIAPSYFTMLAYLSRLLNSARHNGVGFVSE